MKEINKMYFFCLCSINNMNSKNEKLLIQGLYQSIEINIRSNEVLYIFFLYIIDDRFIDFHNYILVHILEL